MSVQTPTTMPCPAWCIYRAGHDFEADNERAPLWRRHDHPVRWLQWCHIDGGMPAVSVWMSQVEHASGLDGPFTRGPAEIVVESSARTRLTGPQARLLAGALRDAADQCEAAHPGAVVVGS